MRLNNIVIYSNKIIKGIKNQKYKELSKKKDFKSNKIAEINIVILLKVRMVVIELLPIFILWGVLIVEKVLI
jgi:hypothetical protein